jgi:hypothetical protein
MSTLNVIKEQQYEDMLPSSWLMDEGNIALLPHFPLLPPLGIGLFFINRALHSLHVHAACYLIAHGLVKL